MSPCQRKRYAGGYWMLLLAFLANHHVSICHAEVDKTDLTLRYTGSQHHVSVVGNAYILAKSNEGIEYQVKSAELVIHEHELAVRFENIIAIIHPLIDVPDSVSSLIIRMDGTVLGIEDSVASTLGTIHAYRWGAEIGQPVDRVARRVDTSSPKREITFSTENNTVILQGWLAEQKAPKIRIQNGRNEKRAHRQKTRRTGP